MKKIIISLMLAVLSISASAQYLKWIRVTPEDMASEYGIFVSDRIMKPAIGSQSGYKVWVKWEFYTEKAKEHFETTDFRRMCLYEISPDLVQIRVLRVTLYNINGNVTDSFNFEPTLSDADWEYPNPESVFDAVIECVKNILNGKPE